MYLLRSIAISLAILIFAPGTMGPEAPNSTARGGSDVFALKSLTLAGASKAVEDAMIQAFIDEGAVRSSDNGIVIVGKLQQFPGGVTIITLVGGEKEYQVEGGMNIYSGRPFPFSGERLVGEVRKNSDHIAKTFHKRWLEYHHAKVSPSAKKA